MLKNCFKYPGTRWLIGRAVLKTLKETTLKTMFEVIKAQGIPLKAYNFNQQSNIFTFANGSEILLKDLYAYPSDANFDELGSLEVTGIFLDEANQISAKAREIARSRIRFKLDEYGLISKALYTCNPAKGWVYSDFFDADRKGTIDQDRKFVKSLATDNPFISPEYIRNLQLASEATKQRLFYGNWDFDDDPAILCDYQSIQSMYSNEFVQRGQRYITTDIAFSNKPSGKFVLMVWDGFRLEKIVAKQSADSKEVLNTIINAATKYGVPMHNVCFDADGIGAYLKGMLPNARPFHNNASPYNVNTIKRQFSNLKSQCAFGMADLINNNKVFVSPSNAGDVKESLSSELSIWREDAGTFNTDKPHALQSKSEQIEQLKRSPDFADAFLMRYVFEIHRIRQSAVKMG